MTINMKTKLAIVLALTLCAGLLLGVPAQAQDSDVAVVVNPSNSVSNLSMGELRKVLAGEKRSWPGGVSVKILVRAHGTRERDALLKILAMDESSYKQYWTAQVYRGEAQAEPLTLPSVGMTREALSAYPGAITLIDLRDVKPGMKVLKIDGHAPGESGYTLH